MLSIQKHKPVLDKLAAVDMNNLTPIEPINLLNEIKKQMTEDRGRITEDKGQKTEDSKRRIE